MGEGREQNFKLIVHTVDRASFTIRMAEGTSEPTWVALRGLDSVGGGDYHLPT